MPTPYAQLKQQQRNERDSYPENLALRVHRALSWLHRAEQEADADSRFIFLWIAFNAAYASDIDGRLGLSEQATFQQFLQKLCDLDDQQQLYQLVWNSFPHAIRVLLDNEYVFASFWEYQKGNLCEEEWKRSFAAAKKAAAGALASSDTPKVLAIVLSRVYVLRNQLVHGGATWASQVNREQIRDCVAFMAEMVPSVIEIMMNNPNTLWGTPSYPVVQA